MIPSGRNLGESLLVPFEFLKEGTKELIKREPESTRDAARYFVKRVINKLQKGSRITLTNNEVKILEK